MTPLIWSQLTLPDAFDQAQAGSITLQITRSLGQGPAWYRMRSSEAVRAAILRHLLQGPHLAARSLLLAWHDPRHAADVPLELRLRGQTMPDLPAERVEVTVALTALLGLADGSDLAPLRAMFEAVFAQGLQWEQTCGQRVMLTLRPRDVGTSGLSWSPKGPDPMPLVQAHPMGQAWWEAQQRGMAHRAGRYGGQIPLATLGGSRYQPVESQTPLLGWDTPSPPAPSR